MKKRCIAWTLVVVMLAMTACDGGSKDETTQAAASDAQTTVAPTEVTTQAVTEESTTEESTEAPTEATTEEPTEPTTEATTEVPTEVVDLVKVSNAYLAILREYEANLREVEKEVALKQPSCAYGDITGDGIPELILQYDSDIEEAGRVLSTAMYTIASVRIFSYDPATDQAYEVLHFPRSIINAGGRIDSDAFLLENGHLVITHINHGGEDTSEYMNEYEIKDQKFELVNQILEESKLVDERTDTHQTTYTQNGVEITQDVYEKQWEAYRASAQKVLLYAAVYDHGRGGDWGAKVTNLPSIRCYFDDLVAQLSAYGILLT